MHDDKTSLEISISRPASPDLKRKSSDLQDLEQINLNVPNLKYDRQHGHDGDLGLDGNLSSGNTSMLELNMVPGRPSGERGVEMTTFRRLSAVASIDRDRFRRGSTGVSGSGERFRRASVLGRTETRIGEVGEEVRVDADGSGSGILGSVGDGDHLERGTIDGGFGWVIVACTFTIAFHFLGFIFSWGVIQAALVEQGLESTRLLSVIGGLATFWNAAGCFPAEILVRKYGRRAVGLTGISIHSAACILSSFSTRSYAGLLVLQGLFAGFACSMQFMTVYPLPATWFLKKRGIAIGITSCGGGLGGAAWSIIIEKLIQKLGLPWAFRIMGLSILTAGLPCAWILRDGPIRYQRQPQQVAGEPSLLRSRPFLWLMGACFVVSYPFFIPAFFIPQYTISVGYSSSTGALFGALYNLASGAGRIGFGVLADLVVGNLTAWIVALSGIALGSLLIWPFATASPAIAIFTLIVGMGSGGFFSLQGSIVAQLVGSHRIDKAIGAIELVESVGFFAGPVTAGLLLDAFGGPEAGPAAYRPAMWLVGATSALAVAMAIRIRFLYNPKLFVRA